MHAVEHRITSLEHWQLPAPVGWSFRTQTDFLHADVRPTQERGTYSHAACHMYGLEYFAAHLNRDIDSGLCIVRIRLNVELQHELAAEASCQGIGGQCDIVACPSERPSFARALAHMPADAEANRYPIDDVVRMAHVAAAAVHLIAARARVQAQLVCRAVAHLRFERRFDRKVRLDIVTIDPVEASSLEGLLSQRLDECRIENDV